MRAGAWWLTLVATVLLCLPAAVTAQETGGGAADADAASVADVWSGLQRLPRDTCLVAGVRPQALLRDAGLADIDRLMGALLEFSLGRRIDVQASEVEQMAVVGTFGGGRLADYNGLAVIELQSSDAANRLMEALFGSEFDAAATEQNSLAGIVSVRELAGALLGERTVLLGQPPMLQHWDFSGRTQPATDFWPVRSADAAATHAFVLFDIERLRRFAPRFDDWMLSQYPWLAAAAPLVREVQRVEVVARAGDGLRLTTTVAVAPEALADVEGTLRAGATVLRNVLGELSASVPPWSRDFAGPSMALLRDTLRAPVVTADVETGVVQLSLSASREQLAGFQAGLRPLEETLMTAARRELRSRNLRRIALAMLAYYEEHNHLPLPTARDEDSGVPQSWRVTLLPFLGEQQLFNRYRRNEPWDSEANREVLRRMPDVYRHVDDSPTSYRSAYYGLVGPETALGDGQVPIRLRDIRDGASNTILVVESRQGVPWTMPADVEVLPGRPLPSFGGFDPAGAFVVCVDSSVSFLSIATSETDRRAFITRDGRERLSLP